MELWQSAWWSVCKPGHTRFRNASRRHVFVNTEKNLCKFCVRDIDRIFCKLVNAIHKVYRVSSAISSSETDVHVSLKKKQSILRSHYKRPCISEIVYWKRTLSVLGLDAELHNHSYFVFVYFFVKITLYIQAHISSTQHLTLLHVLG